MLVSHRAALRKQILAFRNEAVWARRALVERHQPPHGFGLQAASLLQSIGHARLAEADGCMSAAAEIGTRANRWEVRDVDSVIARLDAALQELSTVEADGSETE